MGNPAFVHKKRRAVFDGFGHDLAILNVQAQRISHEREKSRVHARDRIVPGGKRGHDFAPERRVGSPNLVLSQRGLERDARLFGIDTNNRHHERPVRRADRRHFLRKLHALRHGPHRHRRNGRYGGRRRLRTNRWACQKGAQR